MKSRKFSVLAGAMIATAVVALGVNAVAARDDHDDSPLHKIMEKVQAENSKVLKGVRNPASFKKAQAEVVTAAKELAKLGKDSREFTEPAKHEKQPQEKWTELVDKFVTESQNFATLAAKADVEQPAAKAEYKKVQATCTACHDVFKKDEH